MKTSFASTLPLLIGTVLSQGTIDPVKYDIFNDSIHEQWYSLSLASHAVNLTARADPEPNRVYVRAAYAGIAIIGYTYYSGADAIADATQACYEWQRGDVTKGHDCVKNGLEAGAAYGIVGVAGYAGPAASVALLQGTLGLGNRLLGDQGQGPSTKMIRDTFDPPHFVYGTANFTNNEIDFFNTFVDMTIADNHGLDPSVTAREVESQPCQNRNRNLYTRQGYFRFQDEYGWKIQCKSACGVKGYNTGSLLGAIREISTNILNTNNLNAQFTVFDSANGRVLGRCKATLETVVTNTCPELITGEGCTF